MRNKKLSILLLYFYKKIMEFSSNVNLLIERSNLSEEEKNMLKNPPDVIKSTVDYLVSFSDKQKNKRNKPPRKQNAWSIFLKNYGEYLRKTFPDKKFPLKNIVSKALPEWNGLNDNDIKK